MGVYWRHIWSAKGSKILLSGDESASICGGKNEV